MQSLHTTKEAITIKTVVIKSVHSDYGPVQGSCLLSVTRERLSTRFFLYIGQRLQDLNDLLLHLMGCRAEPLTREEEEEEGSVKPGTG